MTLDEAYNFSCEHQCLSRLAWIKDNIIFHAVSRAQTLEQIKLSLDLNAEALNAEDWNIYEIHP